MASPWRAPRLVSGAAPPSRRSALLLVVFRGGLVALALARLAPPAPPSLARPFAAGLPAVPVPPFLSPRPRGLGQVSSVSSLPPLLLARLAQPVPPLPPACRSSFSPSAFRPACCRLWAPARGLSPAPVCGLVPFAGWRTAQTWTWETTRVVLSLSETVAFSGMARPQTRLVTPLSATTGNMGDSLRFVLPHSPVVFCVLISAEVEIRTERAT